MKIKSVVSIIALISLSGCVTLSPEGAKVKVVGPEQIEKLNGCTKLKKVALFTAAIEGYEAPLWGLKNETAKAGGNVVVSRMQLRYIGSSSSYQGVAYRCDNKTFNKLYSTEDY